MNVRGYINPSERCCIKVPACGHIRIFVVVFYPVNLPQRSTVCWVLNQRGIIKIKKKRELNCCSRVDYEKDCILRKENCIDNIPSTLTWRRVSVGFWIRHTNGFVCYLLHIWCSKFTYNLVCLIYALNCNLDFIRYKNRSNSKVFSANVRFKRASNRQMEDSYKV